MAIITLPTGYYQQHDADFSLEFPAEAYGGWKKEELPLSIEHTAVVVMHSWDCGTREEFPGWHRVVDYIPRSYEIAEKIIPPILDAARRAGMKIIHVVSSESYGAQYPGYAPVRDLCKDDKHASSRSIERDEASEKLWQFHSDVVFPGKENQADIQRGHAAMDIYPTTKPLGDEPVAKDSFQLSAWCEKEGINHLIYTGFAINMCLMTSPGGMVDLSRYGILCSAIYDAVTAVENKETIRTQTAKQIALWKVALLYGYVYGAEEFKKALNDYADHLNR